MNGVGLSQESIEKILLTEINRNADLLIGIDDPEMNQLVNVLIKAVATAIAKNNDEIVSDINDTMTRI